jgi:hypothetical protein
MRPIVKKQPGETVTYEDSRGNIVNHTIQATYNDYRDAKLPLAGNFGYYCSYCDRSFDGVALEVEHMKAVENGGPKTDWNNFLLSCKLCNTVKSTKLAGSNTHWPHLNNTFMDFIYEEDGRVKLNPQLSGLSKDGAQNLYDLVKLGRYRKDATSMDFRWKKRVETWNTAKRFRDRYLAGKLDEYDIIEIAKITGCWSIWFTAFDGYDEVRKLLISEFAGTCSSCFDANNHYQPIPRNPLNTNDPI